MTNFNKPRPTPEDEAFNDIERQAQQRKEAVRSQMQAKTEQQFYDELRNGVIEEVALHVEKLEGFRRNTIHELSVYIREMKK